MRLKPYPEYKDSGVPWLGEIPAHWNVRRTKYLLNEIDSRSPEGLEQLLSVSQYTGVTVRRHHEEEGGGSRAESLVGYKRVNSDDLVVNIMLAWNGSLGVSPFTGIVSPAYCVYRFKPGVHSYYYHHLLRTPLYRGRIYSESTGVVESRMRLYSDDLFRMEVLVPSPYEQRLISRFLESVNQRVSRLIRTKQRMIELLNEQKQAIIHQAVTHSISEAPVTSMGIDEDEPMLKYFRRTKLGRVCLSIRDGTHNPPPAEDGSHRLLSVRNIIDGRFVSRTDDRTMSPASFKMLQRSYTVDEGDVVLALVGATTGKSAVVEHMENVTVQRSIGILRPNPSVLDSHYLHLVITSELIQTQIRRIMDKYAAQPGIYLSDVSNLQLIYPDLEIQRKVVATVREQTKLLNASIATTRKEITLIREYRTRLISDVVTDKLDVRDVDLPEVEEDEAEPVPLDPEAADLGEMAMVEEVSHADH